MSHFKRILILMAVDIVLVNAALLLALWFRFEGAIPPKYIASYQHLVAIFTVIRLGCFYAFGLYNRLWQYASVGELVNIVSAVTVGTVVKIAYLHFQMEGGVFPLPRSVIVLSWALNIIFIGGSRLSWRFFRGYKLKTVQKQEMVRVLIVGAGDAGAAVVRELKNHNGHNGYQRVPIGFADDNPAKQKLQMFGLPVLGRRQDIPRLVENYGVKEIIIAIPSAPGRVIREIVDICSATSAKLKILPGIYELIDGRVSVNQIREVQVEDLLGRHPVQVDLEAMAGYLAGRAVLVTGAGGSIGAELCRQVARFGPRKLVLLGHGENSIYDIHQELKDSYGELEPAPVVADIKDLAAIEGVFAKHCPQVVFHAAAHKHVPLMEENPVEAVKNNILGTWNLARAADKYHVENFVLISTDKAVNPTSFMGATKRIAEIAVQELSRSSKTKFSAVRFGNVLASRGSVVPLFKKQIARGGPVTVTHPDMTRYFMTIPEAVQLVVQAGALARGGEVFILDMGEPVKVVDLARSMIRLSGFEPDEEIEILFTGIRPGEKLYEEILTNDEGIGATLHQRIFVARPDGTDAKALEMLLLLAGRHSFTATEEEVVVLLRTILPDFRVDKQCLIPDKGSEEVAFRYKPDAARPVHSAHGTAAAR
ncbi:MAG: polysaccharide biosynthesis protein [Syntrophomonadaceae bacterium]|nr:polysaccharide biosynthesis protein [Syntrophomonadaceae bacterium]